MIRYVPCWHAVLCVPRYLCHQRSQTLQEWTLSSACFTEDEMNVKWTHLTVLCAWHNDSMVAFKARVRLLLLRLGCVPLRKSPPLSEFQFALLEMGI